MVKYKKYHYYNIYALVSLYIPFYVAEKIPATKDIYSNDIFEGHVEKMQCDRLFLVSALMLD